MEAPMFVATRGAVDPPRRPVGPVGPIGARRPVGPTIDIIKKKSDDLLSVSPGAVNNGTGEWQIKLLFKHAYPNPPAWKTCVLVVRARVPGPAGPVALLTLGRAMCDGAACADGAFKPDKARVAVDPASTSTRTLWYDAGKGCLLFGRTQASAMCARSPSATDGLEVAIKFTEQLTERGGERQLVVVCGGVEFYDALTDVAASAKGEASTERPDASLLAQGKVLFQMSPYVSDVALFAHHSEVGMARPAIGAFMDEARRSAAQRSQSGPSGPSGPSGQSVEAVSSLAWKVLSTEHAPSPPGSMCPCRAYTR